MADRKDDDMALPTEKYVEERGEISDEDSALTRKILLKLDIR
jgi:hypothetical protein